ncbi:MAG: cyclic nucleotide-binding domain-containing protein [Caulobacterales bacterium]
MVTTLLILNLIAAILFVASVMMKGMIQLRIAAILADAFEFAASAVSLSPIGIIKYMITLPTNWLRLTQMLQLVKRTELAAASDMSMDWLKPFMHLRKTTTGQVIFNAGDKADCMYMVASGQYRLVESGMEVGVGQVVGELGLLTPSNTRTQGFACEQGGDLYEISYDHVRELYFQNPEFGFFFLKLTSRRLLENIARLEAELARRPAGPEVAAQPAL